MVARICMPLGTRIFLANILIFVVCFYYPFDRVTKDLRTRYVEGIEDPLVDEANILAGLVSFEMETGRFSPENLYRALGHTYGRTLSAHIYDLHKTVVDANIYITDVRGRLIFDSRDRMNVGSDYSTWRDVWLTLRGQYGARSTRQDPADPTSVVLHVAAPIIVHGEIAGVLSVAKPTTNVNSFLQAVRPRIIKIGILAVAAAMLLGLIVSYVITKPIRRLTQYALDVRAGKRVVLPALHGRSELSDMAGAFEMMREALEGKKYVERYVQTLTHEIKSPLSAIRGAAELLEEPMTAEARAKFLSNIRAEANRIQHLVDRMLELSALENKRSLDKIELLSFGAVARAVIEQKEPLIARKQLNVNMATGNDILVRGNSFLLHQALSNLIQNAVEFSPSQGRVDISIRLTDKMLEVTIDDEGPGIPEYAREKVFDKFFSLQRPDTGKKSTGLGLNFVKEVVELHQGDIRLENRPGGGLRAVFRIPAVGVVPG